MNGHRDDVVDDKACAEAHPTCCEALEAALVIKRYIVNINESHDPFA